MLGGAFVRNFHVGETQILSPFSERKRLLDTENSDKYWGSDMVTVDQAAEGLSVHMAGTNSRPLKQTFLTRTQPASGFSDVELLDDLESNTEHTSLGHAIDIVLGPKDERASIAAGDAKDDWPKAFFATGSNRSEASTK